MANLVDGLVWADYCLIGLIALSALIGLIRGLIREVFSLGLWSGAVWLGLHYSRLVSTYLESAVPVPSARMAIAFVGIVLGAVLVGGMVIFLLGKLVGASGLSGTDRLLGLLFGVGRGVLIAAILVLLAGVTPLPEDAWWKASKVIPRIQPLALWLRNQLPPELAGFVKYH